MFFFHLKNTSTHALSHTWDGKLRFKIYKEQQVCGCFRVPSVARRPQQPKLDRTFLKKRAAISKLCVFTRVAALFLSSSLSRSSLLLSFMRSAMYAWSPLIPPASHPGFFIMKADGLKHSLALRGIWNFSVMYAAHWRLSFVSSPYILCSYPAAAHH